MGPITTAYNSIANCTKSVCCSAHTQIMSIGRWHADKISSIWNATMNSYPVTNTTIVVRNNVSLIVGVIALAVLAKGVSCCYNRYKNCQKANNNPPAAAPQPPAEEPKV